MRRIRRDPLLGSMIGKYYLDEKLGSGSFGSVYKCVDVLSKEVLAIKLLDVNEVNRKAVNYEVAAHEILSTYPECNEYVLCMRDHGIYIHQTVKSQILEIEKAKKNGETIESKLRELELGESLGLVQKNKLIRETEKANLRKIIKSRLEEILEEKDNLGMWSAKPANSNYFFIVTELMGGDLDNIIDLIHKEGVEFDDASINFIVEKLIMGLKYIHDRGLAHMDIKPPNVLWRLKENKNSSRITIENCLVDRDIAEKYLEIVYGDLGFACIDSVNTEDLDKGARICDNQGSTPIYLSPGLVRNVLAPLSILGVTSKTRNVSLKEAQANDVWALGVTIWEFIFGEEPPYLEGIDDASELIMKLESLVQGFIVEYLPKGDKKIPKEYEKIETLLKLMFNPKEQLRESINEIAEILPI